MEITESKTIRMKDHKSYPQNHVQETVDLLVGGLGSDCNARDGLGATPLHFAARNGHG
jgi:ankyrin repeat protein